MGLNRILQLLVLSGKHRYLLVLFLEHCDLDLECLVRFPIAVRILRKLCSLLMQLEKHCELAVEELDQFGILVSLILAQVQSLLHPSGRVLPRLLCKVHQGGRR